jgi:hypothetical protein
MSIFQKGRDLKGKWKTSEVSSLSAICMTWGSLDLLGPLTISRRVGKM